MFDIVSVGNFSIDSIFLPNRVSPFVVLGGSVAYVSFIVRRLDATVSVISKVGGDFPEAYQWWLRQEGIDVSGVNKIADTQTTQFDLKYSSDLSKRKLQLKSAAPPITTDDLPKILNAKAIHIAPIANEITYDVVEKLRKCTNILSLDPQGLIRNFSKNGNITYNSLKDERILENLNIYKSSSSEIKTVTHALDLKSAIKAIHDHGVETVIVTLGTKGAVLSIEKTFYNIPPYRSKKIVDPTGAGDVFIGGFLAEYIRNEDIMWCACVGSAAASLVIEAIGPTFFGDKQEIYQRARLLYEKEIKP